RALLGLAGWLCFRSIAALCRDAPPSSRGVHGGGSAASPRWPLPPKAAHLCYTGLTPARRGLDPACPSDFHPTDWQVAPRRALRMRAPRPLLPPATPTPL